MPRLWCHDGPLWRPRDVLSQAWNLRAPQRDSKRASGCLGGPELARVDIEKGPDGSLLRPGDVLVHGLVDEPLAVDVGVVHTLQASIKIADVQPGQLAKKDGAA